MMSALLLHGLSPSYSFDTALGLCVDAYSTRVDDTRVIDMVGAKSMAGRQMNKKQCLTRRIKCLPEMMAERIR